MLKKNYIFICIHMYTMYQGPQRTRIKAHHTRPYNFSRIIVKWYLDFIFHTRHILLESYIFALILWWDSILWFPLFFNQNHSPTMGLIILICYILFCASFTIGAYINVPLYSVGFNYYANLYQSSSVYKTIIDTG